MEISDAEWEVIIIQLKAFFRTFTREKHWFRGSQSDLYVGGMSMDDYVYETIGRYLKHPEKFKPEKGTLIDYLKYNILRSLVGKHLRSKENERMAPIYEDILQEDDNDDPSKYLERLTPLTHALFDDDLDHAGMLSDIEKAVKDDPVCETIYLALYLDDLKRAEVIETFSITATDFDNGHRRLKTIFRKVALKYSTDNV
ncbi:MAG: hypothetical protein P4L51_18225 [Puia sp.]|nr:hypothetical protein [Puia sp.]